jgi:hypothetical protein
MYVITFEIAYSPIGSTLCLSTESMARYISFAYADPHHWALIFEHRLPDDQSIPEWFSEKIIRVFAIVEAALRALHSHLTETEMNNQLVIFGGTYAGYVCWVSLKNPVMLLRIQFRI